MTETSKWKDSDSWCLARIRLCGVLRPLPLAISLYLARGRWVVPVGDLVRSSTLLPRGFRGRAVSLDLDLAVLYELFKRFVL
jgi:hypothetical protein